MVVVVTQEDPDDDDPVQSIYSYRPAAGIGKLEEVENAHSRFQQKFC